MLEVLLLSVEGIFELNFICYLVIPLKHLLLYSLWFSTLVETTYFKQGGGPKFHFWGLTLFFRLIFHADSESEVLFSIALTPGLLLGTPFSGKLPKTGSIDFLEIFHFEWLSSAVISFLNQFFMLIPNLKLFFAYPLPLTCYLRSFYRRKSSKTEKNRYF